MMWVYFIKYKSEAFECFRNLKTLVENGKDSKITFLRTDRGGEFTSNEFDEFCKVHGIKRELSTTRTCKKNGVVERRNRTVQEMARTMLIVTDLQPKFWREAVRTTVYTSNRTQLRPDNENTPYELWKGRPTLVKYFKIFGSKCFIKINDGSPGKFDSRVDEGIFLGYSTRSKAYKCYNFLLKKIVESIDVKIDEDLPEKEIEEHEDDPLIEEEESKEEEIDREEEEEEKEPPRTPSKMKFLQKYHPKEQIIGNRDEGMQTRRRMTSTPNKNDVSLLSMIEP